MHPVRQIFRGLPLVAALLFAGCQTREKLTLDATSRPAKEQVASYSLTVTDPVIEKDSLRHQEAERLVKAALAGNGYYEAPDAAHADMIIKVDYGIDQGRAEEVMKTRRISSTVPVATATITVAAGVGPDGQEIFRDVTVAVPGAPTFSEEPYWVKEKVYTKRLVLEARRTKADKPGDAPEDVFALEVQSEGESHDLRQTLPVLAAVALEHIGDETNGRKAIKMTDAEAVAFVKNPANAP